MLQYIVLEIENLEPLKIGAGGSKNTSEPSKDHIPGSTIRGAVIGELIRKGVFNDTTASDILQYMYCYNGYPWAEGWLFVPAPQHLRCDKHQWRQHKATGAQTCRIDNLLSSAHNQGGKNKLEYPFLSIQEDRIVGLKMNKEYRQHHSTIVNLDKKEKENLFSYQAISPGHRFRSMIALESALATIVVPVLDSVSQWFLGGSKGSGYGRCRIQLLGKPTDSYTEAQDTLGLRTVSGEVNGNQLTLTCLSDCLFRDQYGQPVSYLPPEQLSELCGCKVSLKQQIIASAISEGYNAKWQARYPKETTVKAGSTLIYEIEEPLSKAQWQDANTNLRGKLAGYRTQDGFGWLGVNVNYPNTLQVKSAVATSADRDVVSDIRQSKSWDWQTEGKAAETQVMKIITKGLLSSKKRWLSMLWLHSNDKLVISDDLKRHHLQRMKDKIERKINHPYEKPIEEKKAFYETNREKCSIAGVNFFSILSFLDDSAPKTERTNQGHDPLLQYARNCLNSGKGKLYFNESAESGKEKQFIAELLQAGLEIKHGRTRSNG